MENDYISYLESLPYLALADIFYRLDYISIMNICQSSTKLQDFCESGYIDKLLRQKLRIYNMLKTKAEIHRKIQIYEKCNNISKRKLIDIMWDLEVQEPIYIIPVKSVNDMKTFLIDNITNEELNTWPINKLKYYYKWFNQRNLSTSDLCHIIKHRKIQLNIY